MNHRPLNLRDLWFILYNFLYVRCALRVTSDWTAKWVWKISQEIVNSRPLGSDCTGGLHCPALPKGATPDTCWLLFYEGHQITAADSRNWHYSETNAGGDGQESTVRPTQAWPHKHGQFVMLNLCHCYSRPHSV